MINIHSLLDFTENKEMRERERENVKIYRQKIISILKCHEITIKMKFLQDNLYRVSNRIRIPKFIKYFTQLNIMQILITMIARHSNNLIIKLNNF